MRLRIAAVLAIPATPASAASSFVEIAVYADFSGSNGRCFDRKTGENGNCIENPHTTTTRLGLHVKWLQEITDTLADGNGTFIFSFYPWDETIRPPRIDHVPLSPGTQGLIRGSLRDIERYPVGDTALSASLRDRLGDRPRANCTVHIIATEGSITPGDRDAFTEVLNGILDVEPVVVLLSHHPKDQEHRESYQELADSPRFAVLTTKDTTFVSEVLPRLQENTIVRGCPVS